MGRPVLTMIRCFYERPFPPPAATPDHTGGRRAAALVLDRRRDRAPGGRRFFHRVRPIRIAGRGDRADDVAGGAPTCDHSHHTFTANEPFGSRGPPCRARTSIS